MKSDCRSGDLEENRQNSFVMLLRDILNYFFFFIKVFAIQKALQTWILIKYLFN